MLCYTQIQLAARCSYSRQTPTVVGCPCWAVQFTVRMISICTSTNLISVNWIWDAVFTSDCKGSNGRIGVTNNLKYCQISGHVLIWGNRAKCGNENSIKPVSIIVSAGNGTGCLPNTNPNVTASAKSVSVYLSASTFHTYRNAKGISVTFSMGNLQRKELCKSKV
jgi:hypothetical protein